MAFSASSPFHSMRRTRASRWGPLVTSHSDRPSCERSVKPPSCRSKSLVDLLWLIVEIDLRTGRPDELLRSLDSGVHLFHVVREHAVVRVHEQRGCRHVLSSGETIEREPVESRHLCHLVPPRRHRAAVRSCVVIQVEVHTGALIAIGIGGREH